MGCPQQGISRECSTNQRSCVRDSIHTETCPGWFSDNTVGLLFE
uniref:Uncharacterized protein n=1 Tax=Anguilla anguilla TaxID=7936 RepID=A0A0E9XIG0_ANGAN